MKVAFHTLGCKVNSYETQAMLEQFARHGFETVDFSEAADVYVINTCSVTQMAEHKSRQMLHRAKKLSPGALIVATGCYAQRDAENIIKDSAVDMVIGNNHKSEIAGIVLKKLGGSGKIAGTNPAEGPDCAAQRTAAAFEAGSSSDHSGCKDEKAFAGHDGILVSDLSRCRDFEDQSICDLRRNIRAWVKIQDGCDRFCSYCIIPYVRGRSRCRDVSDIINEVTALARRGFKEAVLTGIDISAFPDIAGLIERVSGIAGIERIRLGSIEEHMITPDFISRVKNCEKFCPHFHLSLQSGCDATLKRMNRRYTAAQYLEQVDEIRANFKDPGITTDMIVGFPGESDEEFAQTCDFVTRAAFTQAHIFKFSPREGTKAAKMPDQVPGRIKDERSAVLTELTDRLAVSFRESLIGRTHQILAEEKINIAGREYFCGFTKEYVKMAVPDEGTDLVNKIAEITPAGFVQVDSEVLLV